MRADLRTDLKDSGALWTDLELNRCIERSHSDASRFIPRQRNYVETLVFAVTDDEVTFPKDTDTDSVLVAEDLNAVTDGSNTSVNGQPDVPRPLTLTITDGSNSITGLTVSIYGTGADELAASETFHWLRGDSKTIPGKVYFKNVFMIYVDQIDGQNAGDTLSIGWGLYTDVWVSLANSPVKSGTDSATGDDDAAVVRDTDYRIDYQNGRVKAIADGDVAAEEACTFAYTKNQTTINLSNIPDFIRHNQVEYPVGNVPISKCSADIQGNQLMITGDDETGEQVSLMAGKQIRISYDAFHQYPNDFAPGTVPEFLEDTVIQAAAAYALLIYSLKAEHQASTDLDTARTAIAAAQDTHEVISTALGKVIKYLDSNTSDDNADAAKLLLQITTDIANLRTAISGGLDAANTYLDAVAGDVTSADGVRAKYIDTVNYVAGGTEPDILAYLTSGDALINSIAKGGENEKTPETYALFAKITKEALIGTFENDRKMYLQNATIRTNAALAFVQEAAQRLANLRTYMEQSAAYVGISNTFAREAEDRLAELNAFLTQASRSYEAANADLLVADRFRTEALGRRDEVWTIWRDRKQYIGDFSSSSMSQMK